MSYGNGGGENWFSHLFLAGQVKSLLERFYGLIVEHTFFGFWRRKVVEIT